MRTPYRPLALIVATALVAGGCATTVIPPRDPLDPVPVYVTNYGRHSSLLLPHPGGHFTEYAFGDWNWFALERTSSGDALRALFFSPASTLGRRQLDVEDDLAAMRRATAAPQIGRLEAPRRKVEALRQHLDDVYHRRRHTVTYNPASSTWFVRTNARYGAFRNCNHLTAAWLRELGCRTRGVQAFSDFRIVEPR